RPRGPRARFSGASLGSCASPDAAPAAPSAAPPATPALFPAFAAPPRGCQSPGKSRPARPAPARGSSSPGALARAAVGPPPDRGPDTAPIAPGSPKSSSDHTAPGPAAGAGSSAGAVSEIQSRARSPTGGRTNPRSAPPSRPGPPGRPPTTARGAFPLPVALDLHHVKGGRGVFAGVQAVPPPQPHPPPARVLPFGGFVRLAPGGGILEREPLPVLGRTAAAAIRRRRPVQHPIPPQARYDAARLPFQRSQKAMVSIAAVRGNHGLAGGGLLLSLLTEALHLLHADGHRRLRRQEPAGREGQRPTGAPLDHPREERVSVPRDDLRSGAVHGVQLALGQRFRLAMRPQRGIQGEHRLAGGRHL